MRSLLLVVPALALAACSATAEDAASAGAAESTDPAWKADLNAFLDAGAQSWDSLLRDACTKELGPDPAAAGDALTTARATDLSSNQTLIDATMKIEGIFCSVPDYSSATPPSCIHIAHSEAVDTNYSPTYIVQARESYRDLVGHLDIVGGQPQLVLAPRQVQFTGNSWFHYTVTGTLGALEVAMTPNSSSSGRPFDLNGFGGSDLADFKGAMTDRELVLFNTRPPIVVLNTVSCGRASISAGF